MTTEINGASIAKRTSPRVAVIVSAWNHVADVIPCLKSVAAIDYPELDVLVLDNASEDATVSVVREQFPTVRVVENRESLAFCKGLNLAIEEARRRGAEFALLLQQDCQATPGIVRELVTAATADERIAVAGAKLLFAPDPTHTWFCYGNLSWGPLLGDVVGKLQADVPPSGARDVDYVSVNAMLLRLSALDRIGGFDEEFVMYFEDLELCTRARKAGLRVIYADSAVALHAGGSARFEAGPLTLHDSYFLGRNAMLFARKHATSEQRLRLIALMLVGFAAREAFHAAYHVAAGIYGQLPFVNGMIDGYKRRLRRDRIAMRAGFRFWKKPSDKPLSRFLRWIGA